MKEHLASEDRSWMGRRLRCAVQGLRSATAAIGLPVVKGKAAIRCNCVRRRSLSRAELGSSVEVERLLVSLDRVALRFPARQSTCEEFYSQEMHGLRSTQDGSAGFVTRTRTINDRVLLFWDEQWILKQFLWGNPRCAGDDLRIS